VITIDDRIGSKELAHLFQPYGIPITLERMDAGDLAWIGKGPRGEVAVGVERKRVDDLLASMQDGRLSGRQLPALARDYDYVYLVIEGIWKPGKEGELQVWEGGEWRTRRIHTRAVTNYLMGLTLRAGLICWRTGTKEETVAFIVDQYRMWEKEWDRHRCHERAYTAAEGDVDRSLELPAGRRVRFQEWKPREIGAVERVLLQVPGIGAEKARQIGKQFASVADMVNAGEEEWLRVVTRDGGGRHRRMGKETVGKVLGWFRGEGKGEGTRNEDGYSQT
jgi:ERCC4-type nuclease